jgi:hypothetical protein
LKYQTSNYMVANVTIQQFATEIKIPYLVHFTRAVNLPSILANGIYPVSRANELAQPPLVNDMVRLDGHRDAVSTSIAHPNCQMFYKLRQDHKDTGVEWVVLALNPRILWTMPCAFCRYNAADARISAQPVADLSGVNALRGMFEPLEGHESRVDQKLRTYDTTDVQAEVLVFGIIQPADIFAVGFNSNAVKDLNACHLGDRQAHVWGQNKALFASRSYVRVNG